MERTEVRHFYLSAGTTFQLTLDTFMYGVLTIRMVTRITLRLIDQRSGTTAADLARFRELERENRELRTANEILRKASAYFAQAELNRRPKS